MLFLTYSKSGKEAEIIGHVLAQDVQLIAEEPSHNSDGHAHSRVDDIPSEPGSLVNSSSIRAPSL